MIKTRGMQTASDQTSAKTGKTRSRLFWVSSLFAASVVLLVAGVTVAVTYLMGPLDTERVRPHVQAAITELYGPGHRVTIEQSALSLYDQQIQVTLSNMNVLNVRDRTIAQIPSMKVGFSIWDVLLFSIKPSRLELDGASFLFVFDGNRVGLEDISLDGSVSDPGGNPVVDKLSDRLAALEKVSSRIAANDNLPDTISLRNATMFLVRQDGYGRKLSNLNTTLRKPGAGNLAIEFRASGAFGEWTIKLARKQMSTDKAELTITVRDLTPVDLDPAFGKTGNQFAADTPLYGTLRLFSNGEGGIVRAHLKGSLGAGYISSGGDNSGLLLDEARFEAVLDPVRHVLEVKPSTLHIGRSQATIQGSVLPGAGGTTQYKLAFSNVVLGSDRLFQPEDLADNQQADIRLDEVSLIGHHYPEQDYIAIERADLIAGEVAVTAAMNIQLSTGYPSVSIAATTNVMSVDQLKAVWPSFAASGAREWVFDNLRSGTVDNVVLQASLPQAFFASGGNEDTLPQDAVKATFALKDVTFKPFGELPFIKTPKARLDLTARTFKAQLAPSVMRLKSGRRLDVTNGRFWINDLRPFQPHGYLSLNVNGSAAGLLELADSDPIKVARNNDLGIKGMKGTGKAAVKADLQLKKDVLARDVRFDVQIKLDKFASGGKIDGRTISNGRLSLDINQDRLIAKGAARIDGVKAPINLVRKFDNRGQNRLQVRLGRKDLEKLKLPIASWVTKGTLEALIISDTKDGKQTFDIDLTKTELALAQIDWKKPIGQSARLQFVLSEDKREFRLNDVLFESRSMRFKAGGQLDRSMVLKALKLRDVVYAGNHLRSALIQPRKNGYAMDIVAKTFDARPYLSKTEAKKPKASGETAKTLRLTMKADRLLGAQGESLRAVNLIALINGQELQELAVQGKLRKGRLVANTLTNTSTGQREILIEAYDGGGALRFYDLYSRIIGGRLSVRMTMKSRKGARRGTLSLSNFRLENEPSMAKLIRTDKEVRKNEQNNARRVTASRKHKRYKVSTSNSVAFDLLAARFSLQNDRVTISHGVMRGPVMGATVKGVIDLRRERLFLRGTYIPAYTLNNFFSRVPIIGQLLGGRKQEGLLGVTFKVAGSLKQPVLSVNPMSVIAPGALRFMFEFKP